MRNARFDQLNMRLTQFKTLCRVSLSLVGMVVTIGGYALQNGTTTGTEAITASSEAVISPTFLVKKGDPTLSTQDTGWQVGGLNTRFAANHGKGAVNFSGGIFFSRTLGMTDSSDTSSLQLNQSDLSGMNAQSTGLAANFLTGNNTSGKTDQAIVQRVQYKYGGFNLSGGYSSVGKDFQGFTDLSKQLNPEDAKTLGLGIAQTGYNISYTGIRGLCLSSNRATTENQQSGNKENGLTRTVVTNSVALSLGQRHRVEYAVANTQEMWDPSVVKKDSRDTQTATLKLSGAFGQNSSYALSQTTANGLTSGKTTADGTQRDLSVNLTEWKNFSLTGGYTNKLNELTFENNDILNLNMNATLDPRFQFTGKLVNNTTEKQGNSQLIENDLLDMKLTSNLSRNLQFTSGYNAVNNRDKGKVTTRDEQAVWKPFSGWSMTSHFLDSDSDRNGQASMNEHTVIGNIGAKSCPQQLKLFTRHEELINATEQQRHEMVYTRALGTGQNAGKLLLQAGVYDRTTKSTMQDGDLAAVQFLNIPAGQLTQLSFGYYTGPKLGAGYLNYRTWGLKNSCNLGTWSDMDFTPYHEIGGEAVHKLTSSTVLTYRQMQGAVANAGEQSMVSYGVAQRFGKATFEGQQAYLVGPDDAGKEVRDRRDSWKISVPMGKSLPEWAANSTHVVAFGDSATWGYGRIAKWSSNAPVNGLSAEKQQSPDPKNPVDRYSVRGAFLLNDKTFLHTSYQSNPLKDDDASKTAALRRSMVHLAYSIRPQVQLFGRFTYEEDREKPESLHMYSLGFVGKLSAIERLQFQLDSINYSGTEKRTLDGTACSLEYERRVANDDYLVTKLRMNPNSLGDAQRTHAEVAFNHAF